MIEQLNYIQQVLPSLAKQHCEYKEIKFKYALEVLLQSCAEYLILVDDTCKDQNATREQRGWAHRN